MIHIAGRSSFVYAEIMRHCFYFFLFNNLNLLIEKILNIIHKLAFMHFYNLIGNRILTFFIYTSHIVLQIAKSNWMKAL